MAATTQRLVRAKAYIISFRMADSITALKLQAAFCKSNAVSSYKNSFHGDAKRTRRTINKNNNKGLFAELDSCSVS